MKALKLTVVVLGVLLIGSPLMAATQLTVTPAAAMNGTNYGLVVTFDGSTSTAYVEDHSPADETVYRAAFWIDRSGGIFMDNCGDTCVTSHTMFLARDDVDGVIGAGDVTVYRVLLRRLRVGNPDGARYAVRVGARQNDGTFTYVGGVVLAETSKKKNIMIEWQAGSGDGMAKIYARNTSADPWNLKGSNTTLTNDNLVVDYVRLGATSAVDATTTGDVWYDEFESYRTLAP